MRSIIESCSVGEKMKYLLLGLIAFSVVGAVDARQPAETALPAGWTTKTPRAEIAPEFAYLARGGPKGQGSLTISADNQEGLFGWFEKTFEIKGGQYYRFSALQRTRGVKLPRRTAVVRILWRDANGNKVRHNEPTPASYATGTLPPAEPEYPAIARDLPNGWREVAGIYRVPDKATHGIVELYYRWEARGKVEWCDVLLEPSTAPDPRTVKLATVHFKPIEGKTNLEKCQLFEPLIASAAKQGADIIVLPETLTYYHRGLKYADCAESIPGESTDYFGTLAKKYDLYIVAGLLERDGRLIYNVATLISPTGKMTGKYRKVTLPRGEIEGGITPGDEYPVFETRFGKVGMMICYDGFFPEVARELSNNGAEIICWPVWGCNPMLGAARACENHVFVISSTYTDVERNWMITAVYGRDGQVLTSAEKFGEVVITEVDLNRPLHWTSLGDFKAQLNSHRPVVNGR
ncbi:MAG TPA: carbon-nitrogen hydrolase family protein [Planctomycetes bacterium]|nr:carbon-nitrogen hydrolase family protein [Planctomycetota bacterium]